ncbi:MAG: DUF58 domain-containing protein [Solirubrobacteraceae bacterium]
MPLPPFRRLRLRRAGAVACAGAVLTLVAFVFDASPLLVPGIAFLAVGVLAPLWVWGAALGARAERILKAERIIEDQPLEAIIQVRRGPLGLPGAEVVDPLAGSPIELSGPLSPIRVGGTARVRVQARFARRGMHSLPAPALIVRDPLDLARVDAEGEAPAQPLLVLPRTEPVRWLTADRGRRIELSEGQASSDALAAVDVDGLRPYRPGTPASRIHWPAAARGAGLLERRLRADGDTRPLVVLDARGRGGPAPIALLDAAVRAAASLVLEFASKTGCGLLLPGEQRVTAIDRELVSWPAAYARLAVVDGGPGTRPPALGNSAARLGPVIYVAPAPPARLPASTTGLTVLVIPHEAVVSGRPRGVRGNVLATLDVSGCRGFLLGVRRDRDRPRNAREVALP